MTVNVCSAFTLYNQIPMNSTDPISLEEIRFTEHTVLLSSNSILVSEEPIQQHETVHPVRFKQILPLAQTWCHLIQVQSPANSSPRSFDWIKSSANILSLPSACVTQFGKLTGTTYDGLASRLILDAISNSNNREATEEPERSSVMRLGWIGCPPVHNWLVKFPTESVADKWIVSIQEWVSVMTGIFNRL